MTHKTLTKIELAQQFLGELLDETLEWSCMDRQNDLAPELAELLGDFCPGWIKRGINVDNVLFDAGESE